MLPELQIVGSIVTIDLFVHKDVVYIVAKLENVLHPYSKEQLYLVYNLLIGDTWLASASGEIYTYLRETMFVNGWRRCVDNFVRKGFGDQIFPTVVNPCNIVINMSIDHKTIGG